MKETYKLPVMCLVTTLRIVLPSVYVGNFDKQIQLKFCIHLFITTIHTCDMLKTRKLNRSLKNLSLVTKLYTAHQKTVQNIAEILMIKHFISKQTNVYCLKCFILNVVIKFSWFKNFI